MNLRAQLIDLGAAADLRTGTNYRPDESILDPTYAAPEQARAGPPDRASSGRAAGRPRDARSCIRRVWPPASSGDPSRRTRAAAALDMARMEGQERLARGVAASPRLSGCARPARSTACRRTRRTWRATRRRWRWPCRRCCGAATSRTCLIRTLPARQAAQPHPVGFTYTLYVYPTCAPCMYTWGTMLLRLRQRDPAGLFAAACAARCTVGHTGDARMQTGRACPVGARVLSRAQAHNGSRRCCPASIMQLCTNRRTDSPGRAPPGLVMMQLAVPRLRPPGALRAFRGAMLECGHDLGAWRARERPPRAQTAALDGAGGAGWELAAALLRPRRIEVRAGGRALPAACMPCRVAHGSAADVALLTVPTWWPAASDRGPVPL